MKKLVLGIAALSMLGLIGAASAEEAKGRVEAMDVQSRTIILDDGSAFTVSEGVAIETLQPGDEVTVSYEEQGGQKMATDVQPAQ